MDRQTAKQMSRQISGLSKETVDVKFVMLLVKTLNLRTITEKGSTVAMWTNVAP